MFQINETFDIRVKFQGLRTIWSFNGLLNRSMELPDKMFGTPR